MSTPLPPVFCEGLQIALLICGMLVSCSISAASASMPVGTSWGPGLAAAPAAAAAAVLQDISLAVADEAPTAVTDTLLRCCSCPAGAFSVWIELRGAAAAAQKEGLAG
jgi:hypothetical protein